MIRIESGENQTNVKKICKIIKIDKNNKILETREGG